MSIYNQPNNNNNIHIKYSYDIKITKKNITIENMFNFY